MYRPLVPCPSCQRHIVAVESVCPFCAAALPDSLAAAIVPGANQRLTRAAAFVFTASLAVAGAGCDSEVTDGGAAGATTGGATGGSTSAGTGAGGNAADGGPTDDGGAVVLYGAPDPDGGPDDDGGSMAEYGAPADAG